MEIRGFVAGPIATNGYLVGDPDSRAALIVDAPPDSADALLAAVREDGWNVRLIVLTHGHWDHVLDALRLSEVLEAPIAAHPDSLPLLQDPTPKVMPFTIEAEPIMPNQFLSEGETVEVGSYRFDVIATPGHVFGQISLYEPDQRVLFGGDTLFPGGFGRVDLPGSSLDDTIASMTRLLRLPDEVTVYPGHGAATTIGAERAWMTEFVRSGGRRFPV